MSLNDVSSRLHRVSRDNDVNERENFMMIKQTVRIAALLAFIVLLQPSFATAQVGPEKGGSATDEKQRLAFKELIKSTRSWNGAVLPAYPQGQPEITILRISIPAGTRLDVHTHPVINAVVLISGELTVVTEDGQKKHLKAGDPLVEVVNTWHYGVNEGKVPVDLVVFYAGVVGKPITVLKPQ
jgi:quercetin dioxygenase-like cupin family protein